MNLTSVVRLTCDAKTPDVDSTAWVRSFHCYTHNEDDCFEITEVLLEGARPTSSRLLFCASFCLLSVVTPPRGSQSDWSQSEGAAPGARSVRP